MKRDTYLQTVDLIERLHHRLVDLIDDEFKRMGWDDINPTQATLLFNLGPGREVSAGEIVRRGYYRGGNASYNINKLVRGGYLSREVSVTDRRSVRLKLTPKGEEVYEVVSELYDRHVKQMPAAAYVGDLAEIVSVLDRLDRFWLDQATGKIGD